MAVVEQERRGHGRDPAPQPARGAQRDQPRGRARRWPRSLDAIEARPRACAPSWSPAPGRCSRAGADLKVVAQGGGADIARGKPAGSPGSSTRDFPKPLIAAVNGPALAGGFEIVLACDLVVAADNARFGIPEVQRGPDGRGGRR